MWQTIRRSLAAAILAAWAFPGTVPMVLAPAVLAPAVLAPSVLAPAAMAAGTDTATGAGGAAAVSCPSWRMLDNNPRTRQIVAAETGLFQRHQDGRIWQWMGQPCRR